MPLSPRKTAQPPYLRRLGFSRAVHLQRRPYDAGAHLAAKLLFAQGKGHCVLAGLEGIAS